MSPVLRRAISCLLAFPLPPLAIWIIRGPGPALIIGFVLFIVAHVVYWGFYAGPGLALWGIAGLLALFLSLFGTAARRKEDM